MCWARWHQNLDHAHDRNWRLNNNCWLVYGGAHKNWIKFMIIAFSLFIWVVLQSEDWWGKKIRHIWLLNLTILFTFHSYYGANSSFPRILYNNTECITLLYIFLYIFDSVFFIWSNNPMKRPTKQWQSIICAAKTWYSLFFRVIDQNKWAAPLLWVTCSFISVNM